MRGTESTKVLGAVLIIGARKFMFSSQVQSSPNVMWWGATETESGGSVSPTRYVYVFSKSGLARGEKAKILASSHGAEFHEFRDESEIFPVLRQALKLEPDRSKEAPTEPVKPNVLEFPVQEPAEDLRLANDRLIDVSVDRIRRFEGQPRTYFNQEKLTALGRSMLAEGQQIPVILIPVTGDKKHDYQIYDGERRWRAAQKVGKPTLRAMIAKSVDEAKLFKSAAICNFGREGHQSFEITAALTRIRKEQKMTTNQLADSFGQSVSWVTQHLSLNKLVKEVLDMMNPDLPLEQSITFSVAVEVAKVSAEHQLDAANHILSHRMNINQVRHYVRHLIANVGGTNASGRKRRPSDDHTVLMTFIRHTEIRTQQLLDLPGGVTLEELFRRRSDNERDEVAEKLTTLIGRLEQMRESIKWKPKVNKNMRAS